MYVQVHIDVEIEGPALWILATIAVAAIAALSQTVVVIAVMVVGRRVVAVHSLRMRRQRRIGQRTVKVAAVLRRHRRQRVRNGAFFTVIRPSVVIRPVADVRKAQQRQFVAICLRFGDRFTFTHVKRCRRSAPQFQRRIGRQERPQMVVVVVVDM